MRQCRYAHRENCKKVSCLRVFRQHKASENGCRRRGARRMSRRSRTSEAHETSGKVYGAMFNESGNAVQVVSG